MADEGFKHKLTAIFSADVEGCSRLRGKDEANHPYLDCIPRSKDRTH